MMKIAALLLMFLVVLPRVQSFTRLFSTNPSFKLQNPLPIANFGGLLHIQSNDKQPKVVFILGGPGSGKGTQSELMEQHYYPHVKHLSVGQLLRDSKDPQVETLLEQGNIVPVQVSLGLLKNAMMQEQQCNTLFLVDGFPRNYDNLQGWCQYMADTTPVWGVFHYICPFHVLEQRVLERAKDSGRSDDNIESLKKRFKTFQQETMPVIEELKKASDATWSVIDFKADQPIDKVWKQTQQALNQLILNDILTFNQQLLLAIEQGDVDMYEHLCAPETFRDELSVKDIMVKQEGPPTPIGTISEPTIDFISGKHVTVSYNRVMEGINFRETRAWVHQGELGWRNVHFARIPQ